MALHHLKQAADIQKMRALRDWHTVSQSYQSEAQKLAVLEAELRRPLDDALRHVPTTRVWRDRWAAQLMAAREEQADKTQHALQRVSRWRERALVYVARHSAVSHLRDIEMSQERKQAKRRMAQSLEADALIKASAARHSITIEEG